ncbi:flagellar biosynthesis protein FlhB [bacterium]|nr:flagellar biosynthesis protein FlhB [FCB group bacterium]MBL7191229.1 flagellar biosynthesis protein FlhB [bacterium]
MAADDAEKTERPTPRRIGRARGEGNVPKTGELNSAAIMLTGTIVLYILIKKTVMELIAFFTVLWGEIPYMSFSITSLQIYFSAGFLKLAGILAPVLLAILVIGVVINIVQVGWLFTLKPLMPKLSKINPLSGFSRFFNVKSFIELLKNVLKIAFIGYIAYWSIRSEFDDFIILVDMSVGQIANFMGMLTFKVALRCALGILLIGILDYIWVRYKYFKDLRMTKQEIKEEARQAEGPPEIRSHIRKIQMQTAMQRMMREVPGAEVVITNPTHIAVALKYDEKTMAAPVVVAKGKKLVAERIKKIAMENDVPIVENKPLAQTLFKAVEIGGYIPEQLFAAVAEILAFVYRLKNKRFEPAAA